MLLNMMKQPTFPSIQSEIGPLQSQASQLNAQGQQLQQYLNTGTLPPGSQQALDQAAASAKAAIKSKYAAMGGGEENSTAAMQDIANVDVTKETQGVNIALQLLQQGVSESQLAQNIYTELLNATLANDAATSAAIGNFSKSLVPAPTTTTTTTG
jgi:hypothetical protein